MKFMEKLDIFFETISAADYGEDVTLTGLLWLTAVGSNFPNLKTFKILKPILCSVNQAKNKVDQLTVAMISSGFQFIPEEKQYHFKEVRLLLTIRPKQYFHVQEKIVFEWIFHNL